MDTEFWFCMSKKKKKKKSLNDDVAITVTEKKLKTFKKRKKQIWDYNFGKGLVSFRGQNTVITIKWQFIDSYKCYRKLIMIKMGAFNIYHENLMDILIYKNNN